MSRRPSEEATVIDARTQRYLSDSLTLAKQLGAMVFTYKGEDIADTILRFAREYRVGHIVVGKSRPRPLWKKIGRNKAVVEDLIKNSRGATIIVLDTCEDLPADVRPQPEIPEEEPAGAAAAGGARKPRRPTVPCSATGSRLSGSSSGPIPWRRKTALRTLAATVGPDGRRSRTWKPFSPTS